MTSKAIITRLRVHVAPVGFEHDRVVKPVLDMKADRIYLLYRAQDGEVDTNLPFVQRITKTLAREKLVEGKDLILAQTNIFNLYECMVTIAGIFGREQKAGNELFFNVSSGGRLPSFAGLLACMYFGGTPYYVHPARWDYLEGRTTPLTTGMKWNEVVPAHRLELPSAEALHFLALIGNYLTKKPTTRAVSKRDCIELLAGGDPDNPRKGIEIKAKDFNRVARLIDKLLQLNYISYVGGEARKKVHPTTEGFNAARIFGSYARELSPNEEFDRDG